MLPAVIHKNFTLERTYPTSRARVFAALADPKKKRRWFAESTGFVIAEYSLDFQVGGFERTRFRYGADGPPMTNDCIYLDIQPEERVVFAIRGRRSRARARPRGARGPRPTCARGRRARGHRAPTARGCSRHPGTR